jgi:hypothetical protein
MIDDRRRVCVERDSLEADRIDESATRQLMEWNDECLVVAGPPRGQSGVWPDPRALLDHFTPPRSPLGP